MIHRVFIFLFVIVSSPPAFAAVVRVPQDRGSIQAAMDVAMPGDTVLVSAGRYFERIRLKPGIVLRSEGDDTSGSDGMKRAEVTIIDAGKAEKTSGVVMAEGCTLDGFTVTNVGIYDEVEWSRHFASHGEELGDDEGSVQAEGTHPAVSIHGVRCTVMNCLVHHNGDVGIGVLGHDRTKTEPLITGNVVYRNMGGGIGVAEGAEPVIRFNICRENLRAGIGCRKAGPIITNNVCIHNIRAGIGCREGSKPVIQTNTCRHNRRAGIGIRMEGTAPVVEGNECSENAMAGIGCRDGAAPILRNNVCRANTMAGIGCSGASPLIADNLCRENQQAGIGLEGHASAIIQNNRCLDNKLAAIGVTEESTATIIGNQVARTGGTPPIIAVKDGSTAVIQDNHISGGGVAAVLIQGTATVSRNTFFSDSDRHGNAIWVRENSTATILQNAFDGYRSAVNTAKATITVAGNSVRNFHGAAIVVRDSRHPAHVYGNTATSADPQATVVDIQGDSGIVASNVLAKE